MKFRIAKIFILCVLAKLAATPGFSSTTFAYDDAYNATTLRGTNSIAYNSNNQRTTGTFAYDGNGNATTNRSDTVHYDYLNRMTVYEPYHTGTNSYFNVGYSYCGDGLMDQREKYVYVYSGNTWVSVDSQPTHIYNLDGHPAVESDGETENFNVFAPDGLVARKQNGNWIYYQFDQQGNVAQRLNSSGTVLNSSSYDAYGGEATNGTSQSDPFAYNAQWGYYLDRDTDLYYCQNRWYDPATGRWLNRDPIGYSGGANLYGYCGGGPIGAIDPWGLQSVTVRSDASTGAVGGHSWIIITFRDGTIWVAENQMSRNRYGHANNKIYKPGMSGYEEKRDREYRAERTLRFDDRINNEDSISDLIYNELPNEYNLLTNNCTHFALSVWTSLTNERLSRIPTPEDLERSIRATNRDPASAGSRRSPKTAAKRKKIGF